MKRDQFLVWYANQRKKLNDEANNYDRDVEFILSRDLTMIESTVEGNDTIERFKATCSWETYNHNKILTSHCLNYKMKSGKEVAVAEIFERDNKIITCRVNKADFNNS